ncbi:hypothetical protein BO94DRAFT_556432 [Aspergillus sclerotioniger CBS 115572]|uniref:DNA replication regulator SLD2 n=1 Tax=Aspergillus sclerotioniger CBS 115572 TaxID=1450535 RepID=A0A317WST8_9EURO|nr:hypothetical protein BO94DRAFT_556432 [Aspergillus sclerotioniger CBS 115572]PWY87978.1 hypothetical protein BO94DRAFT_556432 [Aspergillus sclerotioniger CBS 115572]
MATVIVPEVESQSANLRAELKEWERAFADANGGKKAERNDIKKVPEIAAKYKEYSRLKALESKNEKKAIRLEERLKKRKHSSPTGPENVDTTSTPRKAAKGIFETPSKSRVATSHPSEVDPYDSPSVLRRLFSPSTHQSPLKAAIGPTPQRDGKALGLFDLLSESGGSTATPSATRMASVRDTAAQTPSRRNQLDTIAEEEEENPRPERTPASSGKKWMLSTLFATPTTWRYAMMENKGHRYPAYFKNEPEPETANEGPNESETPSFLRRSTSGRYDATNAGGLSPIAVRKRPQFVGKGLSVLVQGLRDMEEEQMQDDMDVLNEIEAEQAALNDVGDSQAPDEPGRTFKKKGQKRTTRKVRMKPVVSKPRPEPQLPGSDDEGEHLEEQDVVPETQHLNAPEAEADEVESLHSISEPDFDSDPDYDESKPTRSKSFSERMKEAIAADKPQEEPQKAPQPKAKEQEKKPPARKVNPAAHANYRSLKLRNKNTKGRGGRRFGRR